MSSESEENDAPEYKPFTDKDLVKVMVMGFVLLVYIFIFLKILFLE